MGRLVRADALTPRDLFEGKRQYSIPSFQRPYVWTEEDQWAPLWADVRRVATGVLQASESSSEESRVTPHFLGAVVLKQESAHPGDVARHEVIDGQQRMTTLQLLLDAAHSAVDEAGHDEVAEALEELIVNSGSRFAGKSERFKLWPSRTDRVAFEAAMDDEKDPIADHRISEGHAFFSEQIRLWIQGEGEDPENHIGNEHTRVSALADVLQTRLGLVAIDLSDEDDDQLIFETLNDRGTPLLAADLIKNWVFQRGKELGADIDEWADLHWGGLDDEWWREEISQGRQRRARIDIFLQYWLTMRLREEVGTERLFRRFQELASSAMGELGEGTAFVRALRADAETFRSLAEGGAHSAAATRFYNRVAERFELGATTPVLLWMLAHGHDIAEEQVETGLVALESWVVRRTLLRMTMKDVNKMMVSLLGVLDEQPAESAGKTMQRYLALQTADSRAWPRDSEMRELLPSIKLYGNVQQRRIRLVLGEIELQLRSDRHEEVPLPAKLDIEHVMPQSWHRYWNTTPPLSPEDDAARSKRVNTIGNLTLVTKRLNGSLSHRPWTDDEAKNQGLTDGKPGKGKRSLLSEYSLLVLNKSIVDGHPESWADADIEARGEELTEAVCRAWPRFVPPDDAATDEIQAAVAAGEGARWTEATLVAEIESAHGGEAAQAARGLVEWAKEQGLRPWYGVGSGGFGPVLDHGDAQYYPFSLTSQGLVVIQFQHMNHPPFDDMEMRREMLSRLNEIAGVTLSSESLSGRPSFPIDALTSASGLEAFTDVLRWFVVLVRETEARIT